MINMFSQRTVAIATIFALVFSFAPFNAVQFAFADHDPFDGEEQTSVELCHKTGSGYTAISPNISGDGSNPSLQGHEGHEDDIIPPYHWAEGEYEGKNWNNETEQLWNNGDCDGDADQPTEDTPELCSDEEDNDEDGDTDLEDTDCADFSLTVTKILVNDDEGTAEVIDFTFYVDTEEVLEGEAGVFELGTYAVTEDGPVGYTATYSGDCDVDGNVTLADGEGAKECVITNDDEDVVEPGTGTIVVIKDAVPNHGENFAFTSTTLPESPFSLDDDSNNTLSNTKTFEGLEPGTYDVAENNYPKYVQTVSCVSSIDDTETADAIELDEGETVTCTFTNELLGSIQVCKAIIDEEGDFITGESISESTFSVDITDGSFGGPLVEAVQFVTALTLNSSQFSDNDSANDSECITIEDLPITNNVHYYFYSQEDIDSEEDWDTPLYHDRFEGPYKNSALPLSEMKEYDEEDNDNNVNGIIRLTPQRPDRILVILNRLLDDTQEPTPEVCEDGIDNDLDGLVDENDPDCQNGGPTDEICDDGIDNDLDGDIDEIDSDCDNGGGGDDPQCSDGVDNEDPEDELADENDPGCHTDGDAGNSESYDPEDDDETDESNNEEICDNGIDDDGDELIDENDTEDCPAGGGEENESSTGGGGGGGTVLVASCDAVPSSTTTGTLVTFSADVNAVADEPVSYGWAGAVIGSGQQISATFFTPGTYVAFLSALDADGRTDSATCSVEVSGTAIPPFTGLPGGTGGTGGTGGEGGGGGAGGAGGTGGGIAQLTDGEAGEGTGTSTAQTIDEEEVEDDGPGFLAGIFDLLNNGIVLWIIIILLILLVLWWLFGRRKDDEDKGQIKPR